MTTEKYPTGADLLLAQLAAQGVDTCFANPGTTELDVVRSMETQDAVRCVIGLQENVCTGAADGYGEHHSANPATLSDAGGLTKRKEPYYRSSHR
jgi:acetolactate synthase-1/2/3 large subunit